MSALIDHQITQKEWVNTYKLQNQAKQEAQLPQRNSASAAHMEGG